MGIAPCMHAGQGCAMPTRLLLPRSRYDEGVEILKESTRASRRATRRTRARCVARSSPIRQRGRIRGYIEKGVEEGAPDGCRRWPGPRMDWTRGSLSGQRFSRTSITR